MAEVQREELGDYLRLLEEELMMPAARRNGARLLELLANDFKEFGSSGRVYKRAEIIAALAKEEPRTLTMLDFRAVSFAEGVVHATYRAVRQANGMPDTESLRSSLWTLREGKWQMRFHQGTIVTRGVVS